MQIPVLTWLDTMPTIGSIGRGDHHTLVVSFGRAWSENRIRLSSRARSTCFADVSTQAQSPGENPSQNPVRLPFATDPTADLTTAPDTSDIPFRGVWCQGRLDSGGRWQLTFPKQTHFIVVQERD